MFNLDIRDKEDMIALVYDLANLGMFESMENQDYFMEWNDTHYQHFAPLHIEDIEWGASKICIISEDYPDWVIKIAFNGLGYDDRNDYCDREYKVYRAAVDKGVNKFLAETHKLCEIMGQNIYIQERLIPCQDEISDRWYDSIEASLLSFGSIKEEDKGSDDYYDKISSELDYMDDIEKLEMIFGEDKGYDELVDFLDEYQINDLHAGNYGKDLYGDFYLIDFSGYY